MESTAVGTLLSSGRVRSEIWNRARLGFIFPRTGRTSARFDIDIFGTGDESDFFIRSLYVRRRFERLHLTLGRQPISWAFGSLVNPVDFSLGAEIAGAERSGKFTNAAELYIPLGWGSGISASGALSPHTEDIRGALRVRTGLRGFDAAANFVHEPDGVIPGRKETLNRAGISLKGDLGPLGIYGAIGGIWEENLNGTPGVTGVAGADYSLTVSGYRQIYLQCEYVSLPGVIAGDILGADETSPRRGEDMIASSVNYSPDEFTSLGVLAFVFTGSGDALLSPYAETDLGDNLLFTVRLGWISGESLPIFGRTVFEDGIKTAEGILQVSLEYSF